MAHAKLTKQEKVFVEEVAESGNKTKAAAKAFKIKDPNYAGVKGHELLRKPKIQQAIEDALPDDLLRSTHLDLLGASGLERFSFKSDVPNEEIHRIVSELPGHSVIYIREASKADEDKMAYIKTPDFVAKDKALDKGYKLKGSYAPEKQVVVTATLLDVLEEIERSKDKTEAIPAEVEE